MRIDNVFGAASLHLAGGLGLALILAQALAWSLARSLSVKLPWRVRIVGVCLPLTLLLPLLAGRRVIAPTDAPILANLPDAPAVSEPDLAHGVFNDAILQLLPWEAEVRRGFAEGHLPLWSDLLDGGSSPWVNPQAAVLSPIAMLARLLPLEHFLLGTIAVKILLAFEGCWLLARLLGAGRVSAGLGAAGFALGGPILAWAVFPLSSVVAWSPWLALAAARVVRRPIVRHVAGAALVLAALLLAGHPEIALAELLVACGVALVVRRRRGRRGGPLRPLAAAVVAAALGGSLAACQLVPFLLVAPHSLRAVRAAGIAGLAAPGDRRVLPPGAERPLLGMLSPWAFGRPFHQPFSGPGNWPIAAGGYLGLVALAGGAAAIASRRRRLVFALAALALGVFLLAAGWSPFRWLLGVLPLGGALAFDRFLPAAALPVAMLAALGLDVLLSRRAPAGFALVLLAAGASLRVRHDVPLAGLWVLIALGCALACRRWCGGRRRRAAGAAILVVASLLDLGSWARDVLPRGHRELFYPRTPLAAAIANAAAGGPWRAVAGGFGIYPSLLPMYGVADVRIDNPLALDQQLRPLSEIFGFRPESRRYKSPFRNIDHPFLDFLNVHVVALAASAPVPARFELLRDAPPLRVFLNPSALPRFFLPIAADVRGRDDALAGLRQMRDARRIVLSRQDVGSWQPPERAWDPAAVRVLRTRSGLISLLLPAPGEKLLATSLPFPAGWTATSERRGLRRLLVNTAYLGVVVPPGAARVDLSFSPPGFALGAALSAASAATLLLLLALPLPKRLTARGRRGWFRGRSGLNVQ
jgi:hypothetical protein